MSQIADLVCLERNIAIQNGVKTDTGRPYIYREALVTDLFDYLWCNIGWCATLFEKKFIFVYAATDAKVSNLHVSMAI